ncbi:MAG: glycoside hydrolase family 16 protein [Bacteroidota bacterium]|nr:glycoside hydrolase family 16 protein [Bacteroidota bacterium]
MLQKNKILLVILSIGFIGFSCTEKDNIPTITTTVVPSDKVWSYETTPVFEDNFTINGNPDQAKWGYDIGGSGWGNNELQYYTNRPVNATALNGILKINAIKESFNGSAYTSARLLSKNKFSFKYGKIDVRAKVPAGLGTWPAIWMLGSNIDVVNWPSCGEIDIMEHRGSELNKIFGTLHYPGRSGGNPDGRTITIPTATTDFHNYIVEWTPNYIKFYVDTQLFFTFSNNSLVPFNHNFFIILNVAMGGNFGGPVDPAFTNASMEIDYVKVYKIIP